MFEVLVKGKMYTGKDQDTGIFVLFLRKDEEFEEKEVQKNSNLITFSSQNVKRNRRQK